MRFAFIYAALLALLAAGSASADFGVVGGGIGRILIYGDSLSNAGNPTSCEWCDPLVTAGLQVFGMAQAGARSFDNDTVDPDACESAGYDTCELYGERQVAYLDGACRRTDSTRWTGDTANTTCLEDMPASSQDIDVFFFGPGDFSNAATLATWDATHEALAMAAYGVMMDASEAAGHGCVVVLGPPYFKTTNPVESETALNQIHVLLRTEVRANRDLCRVADVHSEFRKIESKFDSQAMFDMYSDCDAGPGDDDCTHPVDGPVASGGGVRPNDLMGDTILKAIRAVHADMLAQ